MSFKLQTMPWKWPRVRDKDDATVSTSVSSWLNFTPASLLPLIWLDATDTATIIESGGDVSQWNDKSGNGYNVTQAISANQPKTGTRTLNGRNVIDFDGTNDVLASAFNITQLTSSKALTVMVVGAFDVTGSARALVGAGRQVVAISSGWDLGSGFRLSQLAAGTVTSAIGIGNGLAGVADFRQILVNTATTSATIYSFSVSASPATYETFVNGANGDNSLVSGTMTVNNFLSVGSANHSLIVGAQRTNLGSGTTVTISAFLDGLIAEIVVFDRVLTTNERSALRDYLDAKWSVY